MVKKLFQILLSKSGKSYAIDQDIPNSLFIHFLLERFLMVSRGFIKFRRKIFVGKNCTILNSSKIIIGKNVTLEDYVKVDGYAKNKVTLGDNSKIGKYSIISCTSHMSKYGKGLKIGKNTSCGQFCEFGSAGGITIGDDVIMGGYISFHSENHNYEDTSKLIREQGVTSKGITLGNNIWVGAKVTFLDGAKVGNNCIIAAGAVVTKEFPNNVIIGGVPANIIKVIK